MHGVYENDGIFETNAVVEVRKSTFPDVASISMTKLSADSVV